jgi:hypothetical protein
MRVMPPVQATAGGHHALWLARSPPLPCRPPQALIALAERCSVSAQATAGERSRSASRVGRVGECSSVAARLVLMELEI